MGSIAVTRRRIGLVAKFNVLAIVLITVTSLGTAVFLTRQNMEKHYQDLVRYGTASAVMLARNSEYAVYAENRDALIELIGSLDTSSDIAYVAFLTSDMRTLVERVVTPELKIPTRRRGRTQLSEQGAFFQELTNDGDGRSYIDVLAPVHSTSGGDNPELVMELGDPSRQAATIGYVQLGLSQEALRRNKEELVLFTSVFTTLMVLLGVTLTVLMTQRIASPVRRLAQFTREVSDGRLDRQIEITTNDEIKDLASAFNVMVERLAESRHEVEEYQRTLERKVDARTSELRVATEKAYALADEAKQANRAKSEFLATMSHEIRTPMTAILGYADLLEDPSLGEESWHVSIETIRRNGEHLLAIINDILDLSKIEADRMTIERSECSPIKIVSDVASLMRGRAKEKGLSIGIEPVYPIPETICSSALRLRQILLNLVGNAIKFTERGLVRIILRCELESSRGPRMVFEVADTGIGINDGQLREIFQPFLQVDSSMRRQYGGTGLGLAISQRLARLLGGDISVQSKRGQGSRFSVEVDTGLLHDVRMIGSGEEVAPDPKPDPNELALPKKLSGRVLLAEDGLDNQKLMRRILEHAGARVEVCPR